jgi:hypothetical protein
MSKKHLSYVTLKYILKNIKNMYKSGRKPNPNKNNAKDKSLLGPAPLSRS